MSSVTSIKLITQHSVEKNRKSEFASHWPCLRNRYRFYFKAEQQTRCNAWSVNYPVSWLRSPMFVCSRMFVMEIAWTSFACSYQGDQKRSRSIRHLDAAFYAKLPSTIEVCFDDDGKKSFLKLFWNIFRITSVCNTVSAHYISFKGFMDYKV